MRKTLKIIGCFAASACLAAAGLPSVGYALSKHNNEAVMKLYRKAKKDRTGKWMAHRGYSALAPENTEAAFLLAAMCGAKAIETDVHCSSDGYPFLMHWSHMNRMTNSPSSALIETFSQKSVRNLWIAKGKNVHMFRKMRVCPLDKYLDVCRRYGCFARIELKADSALHKNARLRDRLTANVLNEIRKAGMTKRCLVASFHKDMLVSFRKNDPRKTVPLRLQASDLHGVTQAEASRFNASENLRIPVEILAARSGDAPA